MKAKHLILATALTVLSPIVQAATVTPLVPRPEVGVPYDWTVELSSNDSAELISHIGAWSWEDNSLFDDQNGEPPVGWTHTSKWVAVTLASPARVTIRMERQEGVPWPSGSEPERTASVESMFPSFTIWSGLDNDGEQVHTYNNRGDVSWAESISYIAHVDNSTEFAIEKSFILPAGAYTLVLGSNAPATDTNRQGFKAVISTSAIAAPVALSGAAVPGMEGITFKKVHSPAINDAGGFAFRALLAGPGITGKNDLVILANRPQEPLSIVAQEGATDSVTGSTFFTLDDPVADRDGNVLFRAKVKRGINGVTAANDQSLYLYNAESGTTRLIAREGDVAPGTTDGAQFKSFKTAVVDASGGAFYAMLKTDGTTVTGKNDEGIWLFNPGGGITLFARQGYPFEVGPDDVRVVKSLHFLTSQPGSRGVGRSTNADGGRVVLLNFDDKTHGIFHIAP